MAAAAGLLATVLPLVADGGRVETTAGTLIRGVTLTARADSTGIVVGLLTCAVALAVLTEGRRSPLERSGLLLCVGGTVAVCLAGNAILLVAGLELGNAGALLLGVAATRPADVALRRRAQIAFGVQHLASLGLLAASLELLHAQGTADLATLPPGAVWTAIALPWALCGAVRLLAGAALAPGAGSPSSPAWIPLAAVPGGLVVLLRLGSVTGGGAGGLTAAVLMGVGLAAALGGAAIAARTWDTPVAAGRALLVSAGGQTVVLAGAGGAGAMTAAAALAVALVLAAAAAPAWCDGAAVPPGSRQRAAALATAAALPCGAGTAALLAACGVELAPGGGRAIVGLLAAVAGIAAAGAGAAAAWRALAPAVDAEIVPKWRTADGAPSVAGAQGAPGTTAVAPRLDAGLALAASLSLAVLPGTLLGGIADRIAGGTGAITAIDAASVRGPGFGWAGGYLTVALLVAGLAALAAARLQGIPLTVRAPAPGEAARARTPVLPPPPAAWRLPDGFGKRVLAGVRRVDEWLVRQPDLPTLLLVGVACLAWFQYRP